MGILKIFTPVIQPTTTEITMAVYISAGSRLINWDISLIAAYTELDDDGWDSGLSESGSLMYGVSFNGYRKVASNYDESVTSMDNSRR